MLGRVFGRRSRAPRLTDADVPVVADGGLDSVDAAGQPVSRRGLLRWGGMAEN
jgi:hypothetical protein